MIEFGNKMMFDSMNIAIRMQFKDALNKICADNRYSVNVKLMEHKLEYMFKVLKKSLEANEVSP